jgi:hypothetical protein
MKLEHPVYLIWFVVAITIFSIANRLIPKLIHPVAPTLQFILALIVGVALSYLLVIVTASFVAKVENKP